MATINSFSKFKKINGKYELFKSVADGSTVQIRNFA